MAQFKMRGKLVARLPHFVSLNLLQHPQSTITIIEEQPHSPSITSLPLIASAFEKRVLTGRTLGHSPPN